MQSRSQAFSASETIGYTLRQSRYLNVSKRCTLRCAFCPKFKDGSWNVRGYDLRLREEPGAEELFAAAGPPRAFKEVVFCGLGEPTLRLYPLLEVAARLKRRGERVRLNTDGLANFVHDRDVTPDLEGLIDAVSISLNAQDEETYNRHCRPPRAGAYPSLIRFVQRVREFVPEVSVTAIDGLEGVDIAACEATARKLGVEFRRRELGRVG